MNDTQNSTVKAIERVMGDISYFKLNSKMLTSSSDFHTTKSSTQRTAASAGKR